MSRVRLGFAIAVGLTAWMGAARAAQISANLPVVGWVERVRIFPGNFEVHAKIDTGAKTSSLNAPNMKMFKRGEEEWVSFEVTNRRGETQRFEQKIVRISKIRRHGGIIQRRPVVLLGVCVGQVYQVTQVNLIDRRNFNYQMLIGRRFMSERVVVDPGRTFISRPQCDRKASK